MLMKQDTKRQLLKVDKEASAAREKAYQDYVMQYEMAVAKQQSEAWRKALDGVPDSLRMLLEINNTENVPEYSEKQKKQYNDAIKAYDHTGNGVSWSQFEWKTYDTQMTVTFEDSVKVEKSTSGRTHNTSIDSSIDLKSYIASAKKTNQELIENAGTQINAKTSEYMSTGKAFRAALTEKYSKLAAEAKTHSNPENYIHSKYFDKSSEYYETNLTDTERRIAYNYEMQMCRTGKINGVNYQDSLFRGIEVDGDSVDSDKIQFERALVNSQISNILKQAGVDTSSITKDCTFTVDPYSYEITVDGVDEETKVLMQNALNVGNNGKNLYKHIYYCSTQDGCESSQVTEESKMKYEAYHQVYSYTGYGLDKLEEKNGTYYTESGENILDLVDSAVESSGKVPKEFNQQMKNWIHDLVSTISTRGWNNVPDMTLSILYGKSGLKDMNQLITYQYEADRMNRQWYSVL